MFMLIKVFNLFTYVQLRKKSNMLLDVFKN